MDKKQNKRILSGMRSTSPKLHIGNYEGALKNWVDLQQQGYEMYCMVADLHALTTMYDSVAEISHNSREVAKDYIASGIDPDRSTVFIQSHVPAHSELHLLFSMITPLGWLERTPTYKEKVGDIMQEATERVQDQLDELAGLVSKSVPAEDQEVIYGMKGILSLIQKDDAESYLHGCRSLIGLWEKAGQDTKSRHGEMQRLVESMEKTVNQLSISVPYGLLGYPVLQTSDILLYRPFGVPVGRDQAPHLEIGNDIGRRFNSLYKTDVFAPYKYLIPEDESRAKLPGLDGRKMSKSYDNAIYISDTEDETAKKIKSAFTTPTKIKMTDPGIPEGCSVCQYLKIYSQDWQTQWQEDREGLRGCMQNKKELTEAINEHFRPIRERRAKISDDDIEHVLTKGAAKAAEIANETLGLVKSAMGLR